MTLHRKIRIGPFDLLFFSAYCMNNWLRQKKDKFLNDSAFIYPLNNYSFSSFFLTF